MASELQGRTYDHTTTTSSLFSLMSSSNIKAALTVAAQQKHVGTTNVIKLGKEQRSLLTPSLPDLDCPVWQRAGLYSNLIDDFHNVSIDFSVAELMPGLQHELPINTQDASSTADDVAHLIKRELFNVENLDGFKFLLQDGCEIKASSMANLMDRPEGVAYITVYCTADGQKVDACIQQDPFPCYFALHLPQTTFN